MLALATPAMAGPADKALADARKAIAAGQWERGIAGLRAVAMGHPDSQAGLDAVQLYLDTLKDYGARANPPNPKVYNDVASDVPTLIKLYCAQNDIVQEPEPCLSLFRMRRELDSQRVRSTTLRPESEQLEAKARADLALWEDAGRALCEAQKPACRGMEEVLYHAAQAFREAGKRAKAIALSRVLVDPRYHLDRTEIAAKAMVAIGADYQGIGVFDEAATWYERVARSYPKHQDAPGALETAVTIRLGLGQDSEAWQDAQLYTKLYGAKQIASTTRITLRVLEAMVDKGDFKQAQPELTRVMSMLDNRATLDVRILAHTFLGRTAAALEDLKLAGTEYVTVQRLWQDPEAAMKSLEREVQDPSRLGDMISAVGESVVFFADRHRAEAERLVVPAYKGAKTYPAILQHVQTQLVPWMKKKQIAIERAEKAYMQVLEIKPTPPPRWVIASASRVGQLWAEFALDLHRIPRPTGPVPGGRGVTYEELQKQYESQISSLGDPLKLRAKQAFMTCVRTSTTYKMFNEESMGCERWLAKHYPREFHAMEELFEMPSRANSGFVPRPLTPVD